MADFKKVRPVMCLGDEAGQAALDALVQMSARLADMFIKLNPAG